MKIAEQRFVADAVSAARLSPRKSSHGDVGKPLALDGHRNIQLERRSGDDPDRYRFVLMEKIGEAVCLVQCLFCGDFAHLRSCLEADTRLVPSGGDGLPFTLRIASAQVLPAHDPHPSPGARRAHISPQLCCEQRGIFGIYKNLFCDCLCGKMGRNL